MKSYESFFNTKVHIDQRALLDQTYQTALKKFDKNKIKSSSKYTTQNFSLYSNTNSNKLTSQQYVPKRSISLSNQNLDINSTDFSSTNNSPLSMKPELDVSPFSTNTLEKPKYSTSSTRFSSRSFKQTPSNLENENNDNQIFGFHFESRAKDLDFITVNEDQFLIYIEDTGFQYQQQEEKSYRQKFQKNERSSSIKEISPQKQYTPNLPQQSQALSSSEIISDYSNTQSSTIDQDSISVKSEKSSANTQNSIDKNKEEEIKKFRELLKKRISLRKERELEEKQMKSKREPQNTQDQKDESLYSYNNRMVQSNYQASSTSSSKNTNNLQISNSIPRRSNNIDTPIDISGNVQSVDYISRQSNLPTSSVSMVRNNYLSSEESNAFQPPNNNNSSTTDLTNTSNSPYGKNISQQFDLPLQSQNSSTNSKIIASSNDLYRQSDILSPSFNSIPKQKSPKSLNSPSQLIDNPNSKYTIPADNLQKNDFNENLSSNFQVQNDKISKNYSQPFLNEQSSLSKPETVKSTDSIKHIHSLEEIKDQNKDIFKKDREFLTQMENDVKKEKEFVNSRLASSRPTDLINAFKARMMNFTSNSIGIQKLPDQQNPKDVQDIPNEDPNFYNNGVNENEDNFASLLSENDELNEDFNFQMPNQSDSFNENEYNISGGNNESFDSSCFVQLNEFPNVNTDDFENIESNLLSLEQENKSEGANNNTFDD